MRIIWLLKCIVTVGALSIAFVLSAAISDMWRVGHQVEAIFWLGVIAVVLLGCLVARHVIDDLSGAP